MPQQRIHNLLVPMDVPDVELLLPIDVSGSDDAHIRRCRRHPSALAKTGAALASSAVTIMTYLPLKSLRRPFACAIAS